ncbi:MAG: hypothetical protein IT372_04065 [Polyangiaceae bacterium]|nr:hypothetical protein [Polyangiaceae bacterium]
MTASTTAVSAPREASAPPPQPQAGRARGRRARRRGRLAAAWIEAAP